MALARLRVAGVGVVRYPGKSVAAYLNDPPTPARERIAELLRQMAAVIVMSDASEEIPERIERINQLLRPYVWRDRFVVKRGEYLLGGAVSAAANAIEDAELLCARCIIELAERGLGRAIRQCPHCSKWFFSTRINKKNYCTRACYLDYLKTSPEKLAERRRYHADYYRNILSPITGRERVRRKLRGTAKAR